ncbi:sugar phosphate isomerase/epimerase [Paenibacillus sp. NEAU-GSW1]|uniref:sugar phosphate isomerase/epimerase family protein n=1 Tax=Paenibacillus sp. NEAU-GSW1 TaxID=2682486 RepID=UPI0012E102A1|nr:sugar phosphate isomerase/epimerase [Paenibacillus sp. NEAU-GSW1]MUT67581.1 TIM barrel protein [Paenibacillus sp. NEAU-GSW1]
MGKLPIGLQLFTLRNETSVDMEGTLRKVAALGFEGVEFAGYGGIEAEKMRDLLQELNLKVIGSHIGLQLLEEKIDEEIAYLHTIGAKYASIPWLEEDQRSAEAWQQHFDKFEQYGKRFRDAGIQLLYHNHDFEFHVSFDGNFVFDELFDRIGPDLLKVEMDIGWVQYAGQDPLEYVTKYAGRLPILHLKDFLKGENGMDTVELGRGLLPRVELIELSEKIGVEWIIVEQDNCANPPLEAVEESLNWLKNNYLNK